MSVGPPTPIAAVMTSPDAIAAGAILAILAETMIPGPFEVAHDFAGFITVAGLHAHEDFGSSGVAAINRAAPIPSEAASGAGPAARPGGRRSTPARGC